MSDNGTNGNVHDPLANEHAIMMALSAPFDNHELKFKPQVVKGNRCLALPFVDARTIQDRLDDVLGTTNWQDDYECLPDGSVMCRLRVRIGGEWLRKADVGSPSEQPDGGDRIKAAFSDALKRAAVKYGIARYLYSLPAYWCDYDPQTKKILNPPRLPKSPAEDKSRDEVPPKEQLDRINGKLAGMKITPAQVSKRLQEMFGIGSAQDLTADQANSLEEAIAKGKAVQKATVVASKP